MPAPDRLLHLADRAAWRAWLESNHEGATEAWLVLTKAARRKADPAPTHPETARLTLESAVEEALCFGWIDGKLQPVDDGQYALRFSPRRPDSVWSVHNIRRVERLTEQGRMRQAGLDRVADAHRSKQWEAALAREQVDVIPDDLAAALRRRKGALAGYRNLSDSRKKQILHWLMTAAKPETRQRRIEAVVKEASER